jgi:DMSO/TMAO reductase YedYZ molybdopterin-dependent catalytic subunit
MGIYRIGKWSGCPLRIFRTDRSLRIPTKPGFKNPKFVAALSVTNNYPGGFWEDYGYNWFSGS